MGAMALDPEQVGKQTAEQLIGGLENLKRGMLRDSDGSLESQIVAGQAAVETLKHLLGGLADDMGGGKT